MKKPNIDDYRSEFSGEVFNNSIVGGYTLIYWWEEFNAVFPLCGDCSDDLQNELKDAELIQVETGIEYEESITCDHCGCELCDNIEEEETEQV